MKMQLNRTSSERHREHAGMWASCHGLDISVLTWRLSEWGGPCADAPDCALDSLACR